ncbi:MAG: hypothetical protein HY692_01535 [Cyanobacteria bacterium NC_groundwater_1444_Ag_S-0.65um_54_12]|nr:hypothetical protein [Cyanobacteria bacterium NC_groundwater_1444_Ag_S-0.65um_54_12]
MRGDGSDVVLVNGRPVAYQGIGHIRRDLTTAAAVQATTNDGYKEYFLESRDHRERLVVYGDRLDFDFQKRQAVPKVLLNGKSFILAAHDDEPVIVREGFLDGAKNGVSTAGGAVIEAAKQAISQMGVAGALVIGIGGSALIMKRVSPAELGETLKILGKPTLKLIALVTGICTAAAGLAGGLRGAADISLKRHDTKAIASVIDLASTGDNPSPVVTPVPPVTTTPAAKQVEVESLKIEAVLTKQTSTATRTK